jgi:hypothetical protein
LVFRGGWLDLAYGISGVWAFKLLHHYLSLKSLLALVSLIFFFFNFIVILGVHDDIYNIS